MMRAFCRPLLLVAAAALLAGGCSGREVTRIIVVATLDGAPLPDADVQLVGKDNSNLGGCSGRTDADGQCEIFPDKVARVRPGRYVALVSKVVTRDGSAPTPNPGRTSRIPADLTGMYGGVRNVLPHKYASKGDSPLIVRLKAGENEVTLELKSEP